MRFYLSLLILIPAAIVGVAYALSRKVIATKVPDRVTEYFSATYPEATQVHIEALLTEGGAQLFSVAYVLNGENRESRLAFNGIQVKEIKNHRGRSGSRQRLKSELPTTD